MSKEHHYYVYILSNRSRTLYVGVTSRLVFRVDQHRLGVFDGFTAKYKIHRLVYFERFQYVGNAIAREKQIKGWLRVRKVALIEAENPTWEDLYPSLIVDGSLEAGPSAMPQDDKFKGGGGPEE